MLQRFDRLCLDFLLGCRNKIVISEEKLHDLKSSGVLLEDVYRTEEFSRLYDYLHSSTNDHFIMSPKMLSEYFPLKSKIRRKLLKISPDRFLRISLIDENSIDDIEEHLRYWTKIEGDSEVLNSIIANIWNEFAEADALFYTFGDSDDLMILKKQEFMVDDLQHEFIHYLEWGSKGDVEQDDIDIDELKSAHPIISKLEELFDLSDEDLEYFCDSSEFETLLNDAVDRLKQLKKQEFFEMTCGEFSEEVMKTFFFNRKRRTTGTWLADLMKSRFLTFIKESSPLQFVVFNVAVGYNVERMKMHIFSVLTNKKEFEK